MAKYCQVDPRVWSDERFVRLSDDGKMLWLHMLTSPAQRCLPGVLHGGKGTLADAMAWPAKRFDNAFSELLAEGFRIRFDFACKLIWLENSVRYQKPHNPNAVKAWAKQWASLPRVEWIHDLWVALKGCVSFTNMFTELFSEPIGEPLHERLSDSIGEQIAEPIGERIDTVKETVKVTRTVKVKETELEREESASPPRTRAVSPADELKGQAIELWAEQDKLRQEAIPGCRALKPSKDQLARVAEAIREHGVDDCRHVLAVYAAEARLNQDSAKWFNGSTNWRPENINRARGRVVPKVADNAGKHVGYQQITGLESYGPDGEVQL